MADLSENCSDGKHTAHLDDTDLVRLDHHLPKLSGDQDLTLLGNYRHKHTKTARGKKKIQGR